MDQIEREPEPHRVAKNEQRDKALAFEEARKETYKVIGESQVAQIDEELC